MGRVLPVVLLLSVVAFTGAALALDKPTVDKPAQGDILGPNYDISGSMPYKAFLVVITDCVRTDTGEVVGSVPGIRHYTNANGRFAFRCASPRIYLGPNVPLQYRVRCFERNAAGQDGPEAVVVCRTLQAEAASVVEKNLQTFDTLDFVVFSGQDWARLHESHSQDVVVHWPDGHHTDGIQIHTEDLKALFVHAPDTQIKVHPIRFGVFRGVGASQMTPGGKIEVAAADSGEGFTCVTGIMIGTFTKPMPVGDGKFIQPTGKTFAVPMCTVGRWKDGVMAEEWLYWDNATYMSQLGIGK